MADTLLVVALVYLVGFWVLFGSWVYRAWKQAKAAERKSP